MDSRVSTYGCLTVRYQLKRATKHSLPNLHDQWIQESMMDVNLFRLQPRHWLSRQ